MDYNANILYEITTLFTSVMQILLLWLPFKEVQNLQFFKRFNEAGKFLKYFFSVTGSTNPNVRPIFREM